jgi:hypothetical protein
MLVGPFTAFESLWVLSRAGEIPDFVAAALGFASEDIEQSIAAGVVFLSARVAVSPDGPTEDSVADAIARIAPILKGVVRAIRVGTTETTESAAVIVLESNEDSFSILVGNTGFGAFEFSEAPQRSQFASKQGWSDHLSDRAGVISVYSSRGQRIFGISGTVVAEQSRDGLWSRIPNLQPGGLAALVNAH